MEQQYIAQRAGDLFGRLLLDIRRTDPERWARIKARGAEIDAMLAVRSQEHEERGADNERAGQRGRADDRGWRAG